MREKYYYAVVGDDAVTFCQGKVVVEGAPMGDCLLVKRLVADSVGPR